MQKKRKSHILLAILIVSAILMSTNVYAGSCPLGPNVTKDLYGALKIIRIVAPLLVIIYSTLDTIKALTKGDGGAELKKVAQRFGKRAIYAIILFFLPMLINLFMQMADVWDANGNCMEEIENPGSTSSGNSSADTLYVCVTTNTCMNIADKAAFDRIVNSGTCQGWALQKVSDPSQCEGKSTTTTRTTPGCANYHDFESCDRSGNCSWDSSSNSCKARPYPTTGTVNR